MKFKKFIALAVAVLTITMAFAPAALATTYAPYNWSIWPQQKRYSGNYDVRYTYAIQRFLRDHYNLSATTMETDGIFGGTTEDYVEVFQDYEDLQVDGIVGSNTWSAMRDYVIYTSSGGSSQPSGFGNDLMNVIPNEPQSDTTSYFAVKIGHTSNHGANVFEYSYQYTRWSVKINSGVWKTIYR